MEHPDISSNDAKRPGGRYECRNVRVIYMRRKEFFLVAQEMRMSGGFYAMGIECPGGVLLLCNR
jgi:hypothetical protein